jgi:hypothetical protein
MPIKGFNGRLGHVQSTPDWVYREIKLVSFWGTPEFCY